MYVCMYQYACMYVCMYVCMYACMYDSIFIYVCISILHWSPLSSLISLHIHTVPPYFSPPPGNSTAVEGAQHTLSCSAEGDPAPIVAWSRGGAPVSASSTLLFAQLERANAGAYTCTASNSAGVVTATVYLDVHCELAGREGAEEVGSKGLIIRPLKGHYMYCLSLQFEG